MAAPCKAADSPDAVTMTWLVPSGEDMAVDACVVVLVSCVLTDSVADIGNEVGEGLREGEFTAEEATGADEITDAVLVADPIPVVPVKPILVTAVLVIGRSEFTVSVVGVLLVTRLAVLGTSVAGFGKIALIGVLLMLPLLGGLILFSFCRRLQNQTRITSFSIFSWSAIIVISSEVGFWFCSRKLFSKATRMLVSMLVRFFLLRFSPSIPIPEEFRALGLDKAWSDVKFSASFSHFSSKGLSLHMFLKLRFKASKREIVV